LLDIGAAGDIQPRWKKIEPLLNYIGFEPDDRSFELLVKKPNFCSNFKIINSAVWDSTTEININFCRKPMVSSHFLPNLKFLSKFPDCERFDVISNFTMQTSMIDDHELANIDFIKLDIQGGELNALKGGSKTLETCLGAEIEISFNTQYIDQPLFGEVSQFMVSKDFEFIDFVHLNRWERGSFNNFGQLVWGDALFLRSPEFVLLKYKSDPSIIKKYITICLLYERLDLIFYLQNEIDLNEDILKVLNDINKKYISKRGKLKFLFKLFQFFDLKTELHYVH